MNSKTTPMDQPTVIRTMNWLYHEIQEDDFLLGKKPSEFQDCWEDEE